MRTISKPGLVIDLFAGGGGASTGIEAALGRTVDVAINHSATALAVHAKNHPRTKHLTADIWEVKPKEVTRGRPMDVLWASPDCTHFSVAKGGVPREKGIRSLAWVVVEWARAVRPRVIFLENVGEFRTWGPLGEDGRPDKARMGETFEQWLGALQILGYQVDYRVLDASHYGAPTKRRRLFLVARCDGEPIRWPEPTHGPGKLPLRTAAECIDWSLPCPSIFGRKKPLAEKTLWRIAEGIRRFVLENPTPFIVGCGGRAGQTPPTPVNAPVGTIIAKNDRAIVVPSIVKVNHGGEAARGEAINEPLSTVTALRRGHALVAPTLVQTGYGERPGQRARTLDLHDPLGTVVAEGQKHALVSAFLTKHYGGVVGVPFDGRPMDTVTAQDHHALTIATLAPSGPAQDFRIAEVRAFLTTYYGDDATSGQRVDRPLRTITAKARMGLVLVEGIEHQIVDIGMRMLEPEELLRAQFGRFAQGYDLSAATSKASKVRLIGNSVCPEVAEAVVRANLGELSSERRAA
ncbi:DNA cytosine methyltransferase [Vitiosangium sp. GDMCC 1.1324]|uniref:DNA cytosine methyltransferase n=1 Tax=Vitiosangium sp. (strain GDMCC 1.1324) TaxID=2138576 RepID=UPI000D39DE3A|nr:DNA cytosine methyltransferase [Vitiosangium sp. GDMCC 1.1324]PTL79077.1 DNA (cytosine-5-)-methyltransferase [Vitiosangium sp. GDMCC 1.1324]